MAEIIAFLSLLLSVFVYFSSRNYSKKNENLITREVELIRLQIDKELRGRNDKLKANVSARMYNVGKNKWKIKIYNAGPATAKNVIISAYEKDGFIRETLIAEKFPMRKMESSQSVEFNAFVHMQSSSKETIELTWDDPSKLQNKNTIEITL